MRATEFTRASGHGFTLIEVMVVVAVLGVIAAIAFPAYTDFVERSRRSEATEALQNAATLQEQFYNDKKYYAGDIGTLRMPTTTAGGFYELTVTPTDTVGGTPQGYTLSADAQGPQTGDTDCVTIQLDSDGNKTPAECW